MRDRAISWTDTRPDQARATGRFEGSARPEIGHFANMRAMPLLPLRARRRRSHREHDGVNGSGARSRDTSNRGSLLQEGDQAHPRRKRRGCRRPGVRGSGLSGPRPCVLPFGLICFVEESHRCVAEKAASRGESWPILLCNRKICCFCSRQAHIRHFLVWVEQEHHDLAKFEVWQPSDSRK